jgi:DNA processing protein
MPNTIEVTCADPTYPAGLRRLRWPPKVLYLWGNLRSDLRSVAIVGTRSAHRRSTDLARQLARDLTRVGVGVVSGGAVGVDAAAHEGALEAGGYTVAVLGSGLDRIYPERNRDLFQHIAILGAVVTPYPPDTPPRRGKIYTSTGNRAWV